MAIPHQDSCLENPTDRGAWRAIVHGVARVGHDFTTKPPELRNLLLTFGLSTVKERGPWTKVGKNQVCTEC